MTRKVMRPKGWDPKKIKYPVWIQPKIDGVRMVNFDGVATARTQKKHRNKHVTTQFSSPLYIGFDGELAAERENHPDLCRLTSSAVGTEAGEPFVLWWVFDYVTEDTYELNYGARYEIMKRVLREMQAKGLCGHLRLMPYKVCNSLAEVEAEHAKNMELGFEGSCLWDPSIAHKEGDSSPTHRGVVRIKDFVDVEGVILRVEEGDTNNNEAQTNELGRTFRSSHQENKVPNGMIGNIWMRALKDVFDLYDKKKLLIAKDQEFKVSPGKLDHKARLHFFQNQHLFVGQIGKAKFFPKGIKDAPRFPQFDSIRSKEDL